VLGHPGKSHSMFYDIFSIGDPAPTEWHGETLLMRDEFGDPAGTALFPLHLGFRAMVQDREVILREGDFHAFVDSDRPHGAGCTNRIPGIAKEDPAALRLQISS
jgi:hypothetical protein